LFYITIKTPRAQELSAQGSVHREETMALPGKPNKLEEE
jgi:hypothetical protein